MAGAARRYITMYPFLRSAAQKTNSTRTARLQMLGRQLYTSFLKDTTDLRRIDHRERPDIMQLLDAFLSARPPCESHVAFRHDAAHDGDTNAQGVSQGIKRKALVFKL